MTESAEPTLYDAGDPPSLHGRRCEACGHTFFPPQDYGCEVCGAARDMLVAVDLPARGEVRAAVGVHRGPGAPGAIATIVLASGVVVRAALVDGAVAPPPGTPVHGVLVPTGARDAHSVAELRFVPERP